MEEILSSEEKNLIIDLTDNSPNTNFRELLSKSTGIRLLVLFGSMVFFLIICSLISEFISGLSFGSQTGKTLFTYALQGILVFCVPSYLLAKFCSKTPFKWLSLNRMPDFKQIIGVILIFFISMPAMEALIEWNKNISFPESLKNLETIFRQWEDNAETATSHLMKMTNIYQLIVSILVVGIITGFSEETFFRGSFQKIVLDSGVGSTLAIIIAALLFSVMHFQFFGFVPRLLMGLFFGYLLYWSKSLWLPVFAHTLNNSMVFISAFFVGDNVSLGKDTIIPENPYLAISSFILTVLFFFFFRNYFFKENNTHRKWQKNQLPQNTEI